MLEKLQKITRFCQFSHFAPPPQRLTDLRIPVKKAHIAVIFLSALSAATLAGRPTSAPVYKGSLEMVETVKVYTIQTIQFLRLFV